MVVWTSGFETGSISPEWMPSINAGSNNVVVQEQHVYTGKYACEITVHPTDLFNGQDRVDIKHQSTLTAEGKDMWLSGHYMMLADPGVRNEFNFWESNGSFQNIIDFWVTPKTGGGTTIGFGVGPLGATQIWTADFVIGKWHQISLHVHWSTNPQLGMVEVWFDGQQVVTAYKTQTKPDGNTLYLQTGLHRRAPANFVDTIYLDDFVEADSLADAAIGPPIGSEPDAGNEAGEDGATAETGGEVAGADADTGSATGPTGEDAAADAGTGSATGSTGEDATTQESGTGGGANGGSSGTGAAAADNAASVSKGGCAISTRAKPTAPFVSVFTVVGLALVRRRRRSPARRITQG
jgi:hypothetical protein